jgi:hypothetical protein
MWNFFNGTIRKCSSRAFQWMVMSVGFDNLNVFGNLFVLSCNRSFQKPQYQNREITAWKSEFTNQVNLQKQRDLNCFSKFISIINSHFHTVNYLDHGNEKINEIKTIHRVWRITHVFSLGYQTGNFCPDIIFSGKEFSQQFSKGCCFVCVYRMTFPKPKSLLPRGGSGANCQDIVNVLMTRKTIVTPEVTARFCLI